MLGYIYGHHIRPKPLLRRAVREVREKCIAALEEGNKGVYKTVITNGSNKSSELVVEVKELAITQSGQVKVQYLSADYRNPEFRTRKGEALLKEVQGLLGDYLPLNEIEWYETNERHENIKKYLSAVTLNHYNLL
ncbi:hypothetical protein AHMF7605_09245 [Adhaeribacter arboris]|uniref:Uncharacterized protein n=1 Tax=Adhaeribacter arboris TaxID=2072846 RepID=A0A2T2YNY8_9BACT|nr:hypothetical protein AHMF7605_09245 [Adhaeribacter arboris]